MQTWHSQRDLKEKNVDDADLAEDLGANACQQRTSRPNLLTSQASLLSGQTYVL